MKQVKEVDREKAKEIRKDESRSFRPTDFKANDKTESLFGLMEKPLSPAKPIRPSFSVNFASGRRSAIPAAGGPTRRRPHPPAGAYRPRKRTPLTPSLRDIPRGL